MKTFLSSSQHDDCLSVSRWDLIWAPCLFFQPSLTCLVWRIPCPVLYHQHVYAQSTLEPQGAHQACRMELTGKGKLQIWDLGGLNTPSLRFFPKRVPWSYIPLLTLNLLHCSGFWFGSCLWARVPTSVSPAVTDPWLCLQVPLTGMTTRSHFFSFHARGQPNPNSISLLRLPGVSLLQMSFFFSRIRIGEELMNLWTLKNHSFALVLSSLLDQNLLVKKKKNCSGGSQAKPLVFPNQREIILVPPLQSILFSAFEASACVIINLD